MVRLSCHGDLTDIMILSKAFYDEMDFDSKGYRFDFEQICKGYLLTFERERCVSFVSEHHGKLDGIFFAGITDTTWYFTGHKIANEVVWHSDPTLPPMTRIKIMAELLDFASKWLADNGVKSLYVSTDARYGTPDKLLTKRNFQPLSTYYYKELSHGIP